MSQSVSAADDLMKKGEKALTGFKLFGSKTEEAEECFSQAANYYKANQAWEKAAGAYVRCRDMAVKNKAPGEATQYLMEAANMYRKYDPAKCGEALQQILDEYDSTGRRGRSGKLAQELAESFEQQRNIPAALEWYDKAALYYRSENSNTTASQCRLKVAQFHAEQEQYGEAIDMYDSIAREYLEDNLMRSQAKNVLFLALLSLLARGCGAEDLRSKFEIFQEMDPMFTNSTREAKFILNAVNALEENDISIFQEGVDDFDSISPFDDFKSKLVLRAKSRMRKAEADLLR